MTTRLGTVISLPGAPLAELVGAPFDFAWIDLEHGALTVADVPALTIGLQAAACEAHVRIPSRDSEALAPALDAGVDGVVAPRIEHPDQAAALVERLRHPPRGTRGFGPRRPRRHGPHAPACTVQIESPRGVAAAQDIARVRGVDALVVGCADLALYDVALEDAVGAVIEAAHAAGVAAGVAGAPDPMTFGDVDLIVHSVDVRLFARALDDAAAALTHAMGARA